MRKKTKRRKNNKGKKIVTIVSIGIFVLLLLLTLAFISVIISLGIMPNKYVIPMIIVIGIIYFSILKGLYKKKIKIWFKILLDIICVILIAILSFGFYYLNSTLHFMDKILAGEYQLENYYVIVNNSFNISKLKDIETLGTYSNGDKYDEALAKLGSEITYVEKEYSNYTDLGKALLDNKVDAIFMSASYKDIVSEMIEEFDRNIKVIHTIEIKTKSGIETVSKDVTEEAFNVYISGIDIYGDISMVSRSDVNMVMTVNPNTHSILLTSIPRDYYVQLHGTTGDKDKLTHAGLYGINMSIETIEDILDTEIDYYVRVNFTTLINLVDAIGGIEVNSDTNFTAWTDNSCHFRVGKMTLNGKCALAYARERYAYLEGDRHRVRNQQEVLSAIMNKALSSRTLITRYTNILESMGSSFQTNIPTASIYSLINKQLDTMPGWKFDTFSLNGFDGSNSTYTFGNQLLYVMEPDEATVMEARNKIDEYMGKDAV